MATMFKEILQHNTQRFLMKKNKKSDNQTHSNGIYQDQNPPYGDTRLSSHVNHFPPREEPHAYASLPNRYNHRVSVPANNLPSYQDRPYATSQYYVSSNNVVPSSNTTIRQSFISSVQSRLTTAATPAYSPRPTSQAAVPPPYEQAFKASMTKDVIKLLPSERILFHISRGGGGGSGSNKKKKESSSSSSTKYPIILSRAHDNSLLGTVKFKELSTSVYFSLHAGHEAKMSNEGTWTDRWCYRSTVFGGEKWCWKMVKDGVGELQVVSSGEVMARLDKGGVLVIDRRDVSHAAVDEIVISAYALWEKLRRDKKEGEMVEMVAEVLLGG